MASPIEYTDKHHCVPSYMKYSFIETGYRMNLTSFESFKSLFKIHNETLNIWTALVSFIVFLVIALRVIFVWGDEMTFYEKAAYVVYSCTAMYTFLGSLLYHWFNCVSHSHHECLLRMDISGIGFLIMGSYYPPVYYAFQRAPMWGSTYLACITIMCVLCSVMFLIPKFSNEKYTMFRVMIFGSTALFGIIPVIHLFYMYGFNNPIFLRKIFAVGEMYIFYGIAAAFYATKIPERFRPGWFDLVGCSHHFWHTFVFIATVMHYYRCLEVHSIIHD